MLPSWGHVSVSDVVMSPVLPMPGTSSGGEELKCVGLGCWVRLGNEQEAYSCPRDVDRAVATLFSDRLGPIGTQGEVLVGWEASIKGKSWSDPVVEGGVGEIDGSKLTAESVVVAS